MFENLKRALNGLCKLSKSEMRGVFVLILILLTVLWIKIKYLEHSKNKIKNIEIIEQQINKQMDKT